MNSKILVKIPQGTLRGKIQLNYNQQPFHSFQGIPYGKPPIGELRFKAPLPAEPWEGILDATKEGNCCIQDNNGKFIGSEDCLYLNVYTPENKCFEKKQYPVMFWVHGGIFLTGSGDTEFFGPEYLMTEEVILVTVNYRLGVLGFLRLEDTKLKVSGNGGLKDLVLALNWVQNNIKYFCGDPNRVTISGTSAGSALAHILMLSPVTKGLFHQAILQSGTALCTWAFAKSKPWEIARELGCESKNEEELLHFLRCATAENLIEAQSKLREYFYVHKVRSIGPVLESSTDEGAIISENPIDIIKKGNFNKIPILIGYNSQEGIISERVYNKNEMNFESFNNFEMFLPHYLNIPLGSKFAKKMGEKIKQSYNNCGKNQNNSDIFYTINTDSLILSSLHYTINLLVDKNENLIYFYKFSLDASQNVLKKMINCKSKGASHGDELGYLFKNKFNAPLEKNSLEENAMFRMVKLWTNFIKTGDPNSLNDHHLLNVYWESVKSNKLNYLDIGEKLATGLNLDIERLEIYKEISMLNPYKYKRLK